MWTLVVYKCTARPPGPVICRASCGGTIQRFLPVGNEGGFVEAWGCVEVAPECL